MRVLFECVNSTIMFRDVAQVIDSGDSYLVVHYDDTESKVNYADIIEFKVFNK